MIPNELRDWIAAQAHACEASAQQVQAVSSDLADRDWIVAVLQQLSRAQAEARRAEIALSAWALQGGHARPTEVAKASGVTTTAATSRAGSPRATADLRAILGQ